MRLGLRHSRRARVGSLLLASLLGGCIGSIETADERKFVYELTTPELRYLCTWLDDAIAVDDTATDDEMCELQAAQASEDATQCYELRTDCLSTSEDAERYVAGPACKKSAKRAPSQCNATVAQVKSCFEARQKELVDAARAASCGDVRGSRLPEATLVSCRDVNVGCEPLFGTLGDSEMAIEMAPAKR
ncbi:MAG: hypothetical protein ABW252_09235 [Polyangiales bacterium]